jgi:hypothetical protein
VNLWDRLEDKIWTSLGSWSNEPDCLIRTIKFDEETVKHQKKSGHNSGSEVKILEAFIQAQPGQMPIMVYLNQLAGLEFAEHDSDMRYGGLGYYLAKQESLTAIVVPGVWLSFFTPSRFKTKTWHYINLAFVPEDTRFLSFPNYTVVPANRYRIN